MQTFWLQEVNDTTRCRWVYDEAHETRGSYGYETEAETRAAEDHELAMLGSGKWVALGCIVERLEPGCPHPDCDGWHERDSLWGIVIEPEHDKLKEFAQSSMDLN